MSIAAKKPFVCGVLGWPLGHSLSPRIHEAGYRALGIQGRFVAIPAPSGSPVLEAARRLGFRGLAVTIPHKVAAARYCKSLDPIAKRLGAVNTVIFGPRGTRGSNTDVPGLLAALKKLGRGHSFRSGAVLGAGGAARAALLALELQGARSVHIAARRRDRALAAAWGLNRRVELNIHRFSAQGLREALKRSDVVINTTPLGMWPKTKASPIPASLLRADLAVLETVYNPKETRLLRDAKRAGARVAPGWIMFLEQAALQFELMTGREAPRRAMEAELIKALGRSRS